MEGKKSKAVIYCIECGDQPSDLFYQQCKDYYCEVCFQSLHRRGKRFRHQWKDLKEKAPEQKQSVPPKEPVLGASLEFKEKAGAEMDAVASGTAEIQRALERLTEEKGVHVTEDDVVIKRATARSGKLVYVITALSHIERGVGNVLASVMTRLNSGSIGIWALRQQEVDQLLLNANAIGHKQ